MESVDYTELCFLTAGSNAPRDRHFSCVSCNFCLDAYPALEFFLVDSPTCPVVLELVSLPWHSRCASPSQDVYTLSPATTGSTTLRAMGRRSRAWFSPRCLFSGKRDQAVVNRIFSHLLTYMSCKHRFQLFLGSLAQMFCLLSDKQSLPQMIFEGQPPLFVCSVCFL